MLKKITIFLILCLILPLFTTACGKKIKPLSAMEKIEQRDKIIIGTKFDTRPFGYVDENQKLMGFEIDLGKKLAKYILGDESKVEFKQVLTSNRILALSSKEVDLLIATMTKTPERETVIDFSRPYFKTGLAVLVPQDSQVQSIVDLNKLAVIIIQGSTGEEAITKLAPDAKLYGFRTYTDGFSALKAGRADAMITDRSILLGIVLNNPNFKLLPQTYTEEYYGIGLRKKEESAELKAKVNEFLNKMEETGELRQLMNKWGVDK